MLLCLQIENFALVDRLVLEFGPGLSVLTGETGAGKSIILDAINIALGGKVSRRVIRTGTKRAEITITFQVISPVTDWLAEQHLRSPDGGDGETTLTCRREIVAGPHSTRSRAWVNGQPVKRQQLEALRRRLVAITAQGQTVLLGQAGWQRDWLDQFGGADLLNHRATVAQAHKIHQHLKQTLEQRRQWETERVQQLDLLEYQLRELEAAQITDPREMSQLEQEQQRLSHSVELQAHSYQVYQILYESDDGNLATADLLAKAEALLGNMVRYDDQLNGILELVTSALTQVEEAGQQINAYGAGAETDPERLQQVQERIQDLKQLCRKYGPSLGEAIAYYHRLRGELDQLNGKGQSLELLEQEYQASQEILQGACEGLTHQRRQAAQDLEARLLATLKSLAMEKVQFQVDIAPTQPTASGADQVTFQFSPNPGESLQPLTGIASGGEMSRFLLALRACFSQVDPVDTLIFDEIDVGVSGRVAQAIAMKLYQLSQDHQVLCVTHQPLVAAMADVHLQVSKAVIETGPKTVPRCRDNSRTQSSPAPPLRTVVRVAPLDGAQRREELAHLAGGPSAQEAIAFATALLTQAETLRRELVAQA